MGRRRKYSESMVGVIQLKVTQIQLDRFKAIPNGLDYLRTCIETYSIGDEAKVLEALKQMKKEREDLDRRISEMESRLTKKTSGEDQLVAKVLEQYYQFHDLKWTEQHPMEAKSWVLAAVNEDMNLFKKVVDRIFPNGEPPREKRGG